VREVIIATTAHVLDATNAGTITVRVLPPGRQLLATVVAGHRRIEVDPSGTVKRRVLDQ
jgi:hypothetical protein